MITHLWPESIDRRRPAPRPSTSFGAAVERGRHRRPVRGVSGLRIDGREPDELRPVELVRDYTEFAAGSVLIRMGRTDRAVHGLGRRGRAPVDAEHGRGWVTAEYSMLPGSSPERIDREAARGRQSGRTQEIQRLIGRALRAVTDLEAMGEVQITLDCDVLQADGGTRTASICGAYVALHDACTRLVGSGRLRAHPLARRARRCRSGWSTPCPCSTSPTARTAGPRST